MANHSTDRLLRRIGITKGCRFNAHSRLKAINSLSNFSISILSFIVVIISITTLVYGETISKELNIKLSFLSVGASIFIIMITLLESTKNNNVVADRMHRCGIELLALYNRYQHHIESGVIYPPKSDFINEYNSIIARYPENHDEMDFARYMLEYPHEFNVTEVGFKNARKTIFYGRIKSYWLYTAMIACPVFMLIYVFMAW